MIAALMLSAAVQAAQMSPPSQVRSEALAFVEKCRVGPAYGAYSNKPGEDASLYGSCYAAAVRYILGDLDITRDERAQWFKSINSHQDTQTGAYNKGEPNLHLFSWALRGLSCLGGKPRYPAVFQRQWDDPGALTKWLDSLDWNKPWGTSIKAMHVGMPRASKGKNISAAEEAWLEAYFKWLEDNQDPQTGYWGTNFGADLGQGMGGTFHLLPIYYGQHRPIPNLRRIVDSTLSLQRENGCFMGGYGDMDSLNMLRHAYEMDDYRRADIQHAAELAIRDVVANHLAAGCDTIHELLAYIEAIAQISPMLPEGHAYANLGYPSAWDPNLWRCEW